MEKRRSWAWDKDKAAVFSVMEGTVHIVEYPAWNNVICGGHGFSVLVLHYVTSWEAEKGKLEMPMLFCCFDYPSIHRLKSPLQKKKNARI